MTVVGTVALNFPTTFPSMVRFEFGLGAVSIPLGFASACFRSVDTVVVQPAAAPPCRGV